MQTEREYLLKYLDETPDYFEHNEGKRRTQIAPRVEIVPDKRPRLREAMPRTAWDEVV
jgi:hypothetical protein